jgi:hypothetical protein
MRPATAGTGSKSHLALQSKAIIDKNGDFFDSIDPKRTSAFSASIKVA